MGVDLFAMVFGLGFVLSFGYWCTNFLVVQRAMAAKNMTAARRTPLIAAVPKMIFPILVILPGMIAVGPRPRCRTRTATACRRQSLSDAAFTPRRCRPSKPPPAMDAEGRRCKASARPSA